jgi:hypothetical protein
MAVIKACLKRRGRRQEAGGRRQEAGGQLKYGFDV